MLPSMFKVVSLPILTNKNRQLELSIMVTKKKTQVRKNARNNEVTEATTEATTPTVRDFSGGKLPEKMVKRAAIFGIPAWNVMRHDLSHLLKTGGKDGLLFASLQAHGFDAATSRISVMPYDEKYRADVIAGLEAFDKFFADSIAATKNKDEIARIGLAHHTFRTDHWDGKAWRMPEYLIIDGNTKRGYCYFLPDITDLPIRVYPDMARAERIKVQVAANDKARSYKATVPEDRARIARDWIGDNGPSNASMDEFLSIRQSAGNESKQDTRNFWLQAWVAAGIDHLFPAINLIDRLGASDATALAMNAAVSMKAESEGGKLSALRRIIDQFVPSQLTNLNAKLSKEWESDKNNKTPYVPLPLLRVPDKYSTDDHKRHYASALASAKALVEAPVKSSKSGLDKEQLKAIADAPAQSEAIAKLASGLAEGSTVAVTAFTDQFSELIKVAEALGSDKALAILNKELDKRNK